MKICRKKKQRAEALRRFCSTFQEELSVKLEVDLRCELCLTSGGRGCDEAEVARREVRGWIQELGVVEDVVAFHADLQRPHTIARQREVLGDDEIRIVDSGTVVPVASDVAEAADGLSCEGRGLEEGGGVIALA